MGSHDYDDVEDMLEAVRGGEAIVRFRKNVNRKSIGKNVVLIRGELAAGSRKQVPYEIENDYGLSELVEGDQCPDGRRMSHGHVRQERFTSASTVEQVLSIAMMTLKLLNCLLTSKTCDNVI